MLIVYLSNDTELIQWGDIPQVGNPFPGGGTIASIEHYQGESEAVVLALKQAIYHEPDESFNVQIAPDKTIIRYGWNMLGQAPTGRVMNYEPTNHETLMRAIPSRWYVDQVETCKPLEPGTYTAIHLCYCVDAPLEAVA